MNLIHFFLRNEGLPDLQDSIQQPLLVKEGHDVLLTCVVRNLENNTLLWKLKNQVLTAGEIRVTTDLRFDILHDAGTFLHMFHYVICLRN